MAVLRWRDAAALPHARFTFDAAYIAAMLAAPHAILYVLLSLEACSLPIGAILLFAALAGIMYLTRNLDWSGLRSATATD